MRTGLQLFRHEHLTSELPCFPVRCCSSSVGPEHTSFTPGSAPGCRVLVNGIVGYRVSEKLQVNLVSHGNKTVSVSARGLTTEHSSRY